MTVTYYDVEQGSDEWEKLRCGMITASTIKNLMTAKGQVSQSEKSRAYLYEIASQRVSGYVDPQFYGYDMERGHADEILAREMYEELYGPVEERGFYKLEADGFSLGYSPDGMTFDGGVIEIKSRLQKFQIKAFDEDLVPEEHMIQCQAALLVTGLPYLDYVQYCAGWEPFIKRVLPEKKFIEAIVTTCQLAESSIKKIIDNYTERSVGLEKSPMRIVSEGWDE